MGDRTLTPMLRAVAAVCLIELVASLGPEVSLAANELAERAELAFVENGLLRVGLDRRDGKLLELLDLADQHNAAGDGSDLGGLWELELLVEGKSAVLSPAQAKTFHWEIPAAEPSRLRLTWNGFTLPGTSACKVEAEVRVDAGTPMSRWGIAVEKPAGAALKQIRFPRVWGLRRRENERLAVPIWMGEQAADPRSLLYDAKGRGRRLAWSYPGMLSLQCLAFYEDGGPGFYAASDDTAALRKTFALWGTAGRQVHFETVHYPEGHATQADRYVLPYQVLLGTFHGDWVTAAQRYRAWGTKQSWAAESRLRRGLTPNWVLETGAWVWNRGRSPNVLPPAAVFQQQLGLPVAVFWHWWHGCAYDIGLPEYLPPREGTDPFRRAVSRAHDDGLHMLVYMNQRAWGITTRSWKEEGAEPFAVKGEDGGIRKEVYNIFTKQALAPMCLATSFWRNKYAGLAETAFEDLGVDGIYMDQACSHLPCYDPHHGHPLGGGRSWMEGFRALAQEIRGRCDAGRRVVLAGEGCGEAWLPCLDLMLTLQVSKERYSPLNHPWEVIPFFQAVYHRYAVTYGSYSSLAMPPYDELWAAEFAPARPLELLDRKYSRQFRLEQARAFVWGQQPTVANFLPAHLHERSQEMALVMRLARLRSRAAKYLLYGEFFPPPEIHAPEATSDFSRLSIYAGQQDRLTSYQKRHPLALAGAWRAADGDMAVPLVNIGDDALSLSFAIDPACYGLPKRIRASRTDESGRRPIELLGGDAPTVKLELPPRDACVLELSGSE